MKIKKTSDALARTLDFMIFGPYGSGKTYSIRTLPCDIDQILIMSSEDGTASLADVDIDMVDCFSFREFEEIMHRLETGLETGSHDYQWIVLDSGTVLAELMIDEFEDQFNQSNRSGQADGKQVYGAMARSMTRVAQRLIRSPFNTVMMTRCMKYISPDYGINVWAPSFPGKALIKDQIIPHMYDSVFAAIDTGDDYVWQTRADKKLDARCRWGCLDDIEPQDFATVVEKITAAIGTNKQRTKENEG